MLVYELDQTQERPALFVSVKSAKTHADEVEDIKWATPWTTDGKPVTNRTRQLAAGGHILTIITQRIANVRVYGGDDLDTGMEDEG
ncbi:MAG: hypothetical protein Q7O66_19855 [Dehalococcoidia bacterium]|nr:hypothetical protein [Dehalococcoidia bacterium]